MEEIWKDIEGYEGVYQVSNLGRVKSLTRFKKDGKSGGGHIQKEKILKPKIGTSGYLEVDLRRNGGHKYVRIHRLVAQTFILNFDNLPIVNHKDENKTNNCVDNLEWCSVKYNTNYGTTRERSSEKRRKPVVQIDRTNKIINVYPSIKEAKRKTGVGHISCCCNNRRKTAGGYKWRYTDEIYNKQQNKDSKSN